MDLSPYSPAQCAQGQHYLYLCSLHRSIGIRSAVRCLLCAAFGKGKCKVRRRTGHECPKEEKRYNSTTSLTSAQDGVSGQRDTPAALHPPEKDLVPVVWEAGWALGPVWTGAENLASIGIQSPDRPARSQSLYRLS